MLYDVAKSIQIIINENCKPEYCQQSHEQLSCALVLWLDKADVKTACRGLLLDISGALIHHCVSSIFDIVEFIGNESEIVLFAPKINAMLENMMRTVFLAGSNIIRVSQVLIVADHHAIGSLVSVPQGGCRERDVWSASSMSFAHRVAYQGPSFFTMLHRHEIRKLSEAVVERYRLHNPRASAVMCKNQLAYVLMAYGQQLKAPALVVDDLQDRFMIVPPVMHIVAWYVHSLSNIIVVYLLMDIIC